MRPSMALDVPTGGGQSGTWPQTRGSVCPHDCPSTCALEVELLGPDRIGTVRGAADNDYTSGVICAKVARYAERVHHPDRLTRPLLRIGPKGSGQFKPISWDEALDRVAESFTQVAARDGPLRPDRLLGRQSGRYPGQRDGARDPRAQGARRQAGGD